MEISKQALAAQRHQIADRRKKCPGQLRKTFGETPSFVKVLWNWRFKLSTLISTRGGKTVFGKKNTSPANISVNLIDMLWNGEKKRYIQLGTVMTAPEHRGKGFSRKLMETVFDDWKEKCDAVYLFANDSVLDFYPKFGFRKADEYQVSLKCSRKTGNVHKLDMSKPQDLQILFTHYQKSNPYSRFPMVDNKGLLAFYCTGFLKENVYFLQDFDTVAVVETDGTDCICYDLFSDTKADLEKILEVLAVPETKRMILGFTPNESIGQASLLKEDDTTLFLLDGKDDLFHQHPLMFPLLSHA